jgi:hypothetical protein
MAHGTEAGPLDRCLRYAARILSLLWAVWWTFFVWLTVAGEGFSKPGVLVALCLSALFLGTVVIAWRWERLGSFVLLVEGLVVLIGYAQASHGLPQSTVVLVISTLALPPLLAALFLTICRRN